MQRLYSKSKIMFTLVFIFIYMIGASITDIVSALVGIPHLFTIIFLLTLSTILIKFLRKTQLLEFYGICPPKIEAKKVLFYLPLLVLVATNLFLGVTLRLSITRTLLFVVKMGFVAFLEELIFRGFLFKSMAKDNVKTAVIVSSVTFGAGHIINLFNGSGMGIVANLCQIISAIAVGFLFTIIFIKVKSLYPMIIYHFLINSVSAFVAREATYIEQIISAAAVLILTVLYSAYIIKFVKEKKVSK